MLFIREYNYIRLTKNPVTSMFFFYEHIHTLLLLQN